MCAALLLLLFAQPASAEMIKWVDANGTAHIAESLGEIPPEFRASATTLGGDDERVRIIPKEPEEEQESGWFFLFASDETEAKPQVPSSSSAAAAPAKKGRSRIPEFTFLQGLGLIVVQFFVSILVLASCAVLIGERADNLGGKAFGSIFAQRFLMFAAFLWISHATTMNFVPQSMTLGDLAKVLITPILAELGIMTVILRYTICEVIGRAVMLSVLFCAIDAMAQGLLLFGAVILVS
jgi:hypothetical protein